MGIKSIKYALIYIFGKCLTSQKKKKNMFFKRELKLLALLHLCILVLVAVLVHNLVKNA